MRLLNEGIRLLAIAVFSPAIGFGAMVLLEAARIVTPQNVNKGPFVLLGFTIAIAVALFLFRNWPSQYSHHKSPSQTPPTGSTADT
jgi:hypothetical protein